MAGRVSVPNRQTFPRSRVSRLQFVFDFISPYAWLGWNALPAIEEATGVTAEPAPVLFAGLLNHHGQLGPAEIPSKRMYMFKDALRRAKQAGLPLVPPPAHPFNPLIALRVASLDLEPGTRKRVIDGLFRVAWGGDRPAGADAGLDREETVRAVLARLMSTDQAEKTLTRAGEPEAKQRLRSQTEAAIADEVFGVPTFLATNASGRTEVFWGYDGIDLLTAYLRDGDLIEADEVDRWRGLPATADRRGST